MIVLAQVPAPTIQTIRAPKNRDGDPIKAGPAVLVFFAGSREPSDSTLTEEIDV